MNAVFSNLRFWRWTGFFGNGHVTYAPGVLEADDFRNPARMIEEIMGANPSHDPQTGGLLDGRSESEFYAAVWMHAGWWDKPHQHEWVYARTDEDWWDGDETDVYECACGAKDPRYIPR